MEQIIGWKGLAQHHTVTTLFTTTAVVVSICKYTWMAI
jgi:hypothetical protein